MKIWLLLILILAILVRIVFLNKIPPGIANDEINIIINAQSLLNTAHNIPGVITGILGSQTGDPGGGIHSEISSYLLIPFIALFGFSWPVVKLPFIFASIGIVLISYLLVKKLVNKDAALFAAFFASINPWLIFFARSAYESIFSAFFYLLAIYIIFSFKKWKILWSIPFFILGFLSYFSAKTLMVPLSLAALMAVKLLGLKDSVKPVLLINVILLIFLSFYYPILIKNPAGVRFNELKNQTTKSLVDTKRTLSLDSPINSFYENKLVEELRVRLQASLGLISATYLFVNGQPENIPSLNTDSHGPLYLIDLPLIILGFFFLIKTNQKLFFTLLGFISVTLIPNFLNLAGTTYTIRTVILFPLLTIISALGIYYIKSVFSHTFFSKIYVIVLIMYILFFGNFIFEYFMRLPIDKNEGWFLSDRLLSRYINLSIKKENSDITVVSPSPKFTMYRYLFYNNLYNSSSIQSINNKLSTRDYSVGRVKIINDCPGDLLTNNKTLIIDTSLKCSKDLKGSAIASPKDGRAQYIITNDKLCHLLVNRHYPLIKNLSELDIEHLSDQEFCQKYITNILF